MAFEYAGGRPCDRRVAGALTVGLGVVAMAFWKSMPRCLPDCRAASAVVFLVAATATAFEVDLDQPARVKVKVRDTHGRPVPGAVVTVSRREVADLGNVRCRLIQQIVDGLQNLPDGYERFLRMGLIRRPPSKRDFDRSDPRTLSLMLRPWSQKQVRTHFDGLRKASWITGERESANAPWQYRLPAELNMSSSTFCGLPAANELFATEARSA